MTSSKQDIDSIARINYYISREELKIQQSEAAITRLKEAAEEQNVNLIRMYQATIDEAQARIEKIRSGEYEPRYSAKAPKFTKLPSNSHFIHLMKNVKSLGKFVRPTTAGDLLSYLRVQRGFIFDRQTLSMLDNCKLLSSERGYHLTELGEQVLKCYCC